MSAGWWWLGRGKEHGSCMQMIQKGFDSLARQAVHVDSSGLEALQVTKAGWSWLGEGN